MCRARVWRGDRDGARLRERNRWFGVTAWGYVMVILLGSVHLDWYYAVDGYVAIPGTLIIWQLTARVLRHYARERLL